ncbi:hypothetical protein [Marinimicrobium locisalis]|uniref:hypothetical protein n=1 Tax=Marinimicrobium locisalis TaxID=546022 RepID=UPI003221A9B6
MAFLIKKLAVVTTMAILSVAGTLYASFSLVSDATSQSEAIENGTPLIVIKTFHSYLPGTIIIGAGLFLCSMALYAILYRETLYKKLMPICNWIVLIGIITIPIGGVGISYYWHYEAKNNGYVKCGLLDKISTTKMHTSYWGKEKSFCNNIQVAKIISGTSMQDLERANSYLQQQIEEKK